MTDLSPADYDFNALLEVCRNQAAEIILLGDEIDTLRTALIDTLGYVPAAMRDKLVKMLGYNFLPEEADGIEQQEGRPS